MKFIRLPLLFILFSYKNSEEVLGTEVKGSDALNGTAAQYEEMAHSQPCTRFLFSMVTDMVLVKMPVVVLVLPD
ncbi:MAG: hypothetical protein V8Q76_15495, partial [Bacteroides intestinalis]